MGIKICHPTLETRVRREIVDEMMGVISKLGDVLFPGGLGWGATLCVVAVAAVKFTFV